MAACTCRFNEPEWLQDTEEPFIQRRDRLPEPAEIPHKPGIWELIKDFVGMDLAKVSYICHTYSPRHQPWSCVNFS